MQAPGSAVTFSRPDGKKVEGYLALPKEEKGAPSVIVLQEWWGLNDQIRGVADRLANAGYIALVPDLYRGESTVEEEEAHHLMAGLDFAEVASQDVAGAVQFLKAKSDRIAVMGYCMGGALTLLSLSHNPELVAGAVWYGFPPIEYIDASRIKAAVIGHWATQDAFFSIDTVGEIEERFREAKVDFEFHRYLAHHGFANETAVGNGRISRTQYDAAWSQQAWDRTLTFFGRTLWS
ncbi:dienelactone hydrolase family protein [Burkholderia sp. 9120]|uniref:dienelactone hydrolase family protein n=1 Tax=Burkholderia sp. 9120 TaxID=1500897 RepID=UPI0005544235|nr:dienelactone hydrolase family protein [Burkholderia sp. 9120]